VANASDFHPEKIPVAEFPYAPGTGVTGSFGVLSTVIDRDGFAFLACCAAHERAGTASGYYAQRDKGRILGRDEAATSPPPDDCGRDEPVTEWQESDVGTVLPCGCEVGHFNLPCEWHQEQYGVARPDCGDCRFGVPAVLHECGEG
jgi:hypothetical protein